jgi:hypothetical protein
MKTSLCIWAFGPMITRFGRGGHTRSSLGCASLRLRVWPPRHSGHQT